MLREQDQAGALPAALSISRDAKSRCRSGLHRPGCGGSTPPSCRGRVASIAAMQRSLKPQSTGQHRGDPPAFARCAAAGEGCPPKHGVRRRALSPDTVRLRLASHFGGGTRIEKSMRGFGAARSESSFCLPLPPPFRCNAPVAQLPECDASNVGDVGETAFREANVPDWATDLQGLGSQSFRECQFHLRFAICD